MSKKPSVPKGTRDFLPAQSLKRQYIFDTAKQVFLRYGYAPIETPAMENLDTLLGKYGDEGDKLIFKIIDSGEKPLRKAYALLEPRRDEASEEFYKICIEAIRESLEYAFQSRREEPTIELILDSFEEALWSSDKFNRALQSDSVRRSAVRLIKGLVSSFLNEIVLYGVSENPDKTRIEFLVHVTNEQLKNKLFSKYSQDFVELFRTSSILQSYYDTDQGEHYKDITEKALRYDLTVPFARFVVQNQNELSFPFKRYQIQPVWRADRPQKGRYREFYQCDVDVIGSDSLLNEAELLCIIDDVFAELGLSDITIRLNNRKILHGIAVAAGLAEHFTSMTVAIDKLDKIGLEGVKQEMVRNGLPEAGVKKALALINLKSDAQQTLKMLSGALTGVEEAYRGIEEVKQVLDRLPEAVREKVTIDLTLARGLNYYTGAIIEVGHPDFPSSICGGGRYDDLTGIFGLQGMSGVGVSFGADRIYDLMEDKGLFDHVVQAGSEVLFVNFGKAEVAAAWNLAADLRAEGVSCEVYPDAAKMKKQMKYANDRGIHFVVMIGEEELKKKEATVKDMRTGEQVQKTHKELVAYLSGQV